ncbi:MAG TPA: ATP-grasp domain-containing protein [Candidatus Thermoplasmatota archaeon]|nr:ATP-grasp domain-containing protein [Candidatus Thermoplasmatota archaeon]
MRTLLVTGGGGSAARNVVDSLRVADEPYRIVLSDVSKYFLPLVEADAKYLVPPATAPEYVDAVNAIVAAEGVDFVHPQPDVEVKMVGKLRGRIHARTKLPADATIELCQDKMRFNEVLAKKGVPAPRSILVKDEAGVADAMRQLPGDTYWVRAIRGYGSRAAIPVKTPRQADQWIRYWIEMKGLKYDDFMVAEYLPGREFAFQSIWHEGKLVTSQARERVQSILGHLVPSGQTSSPSVARTVRRADVNQVATDAVLAADPRPDGVFCVDLKENAQGVPCVTEINCGRFFTTSNFFARAGANMPHWHVKLAMGDKLPELPRHDALPADLYWVRMLDMGHKVVTEQEWAALPTWQQARR